MTTRANINIISPDHTFPYYIGYRGNLDEKTIESLMWSADGDDVRFFDRTHNQLIRTGNDWIPLTAFGSTQYVPFESTVTKLAVRKARAARVWDPYEWVDSGPSGDPILPNGNLPYLTYIPLNDKTYSADLQNRSQTWVYYGMLNTSHELREDGTELATFSYNETCIPLNFSQYTFPQAGTEEMVYTEQINGTIQIGFVGKDAYTLAEEQFGNEYDVSWYVLNNLVSDPVQKEYWKSDGFQIHVNAWLDCSEKWLSRRNHHTYFSPTGKDRPDGQPLIVNAEGGNIVKDNPIIPKSSYSSNIDAIQDNLTYKLLCKQPITIGGAAINDGKKHSIAILVWSDHGGIFYENMASCLLRYDPELAPWTEPEPIYHTITYNLSHTTSSNNTSTVEEGSAYSTTISVNPGYELKEVSVIMGGDITESTWDVNTSTIAIPSVTSGVVISARAEKIKKPEEPETPWTPPAIDDTPRDWNRGLYKEAEIDLYFPQWSVDTFSPGTLYAFSINTWIHGRTVWLGSWLLNRLDACAAHEVVRFQDTNYYEKISFRILDPEDLIYSDNWDTFRKQICGEPASTNATGSILNFTLYPVEKHGDVYIKKNGYTGGATGINIIESREGYWGLDLSWNPVGTNGWAEFEARTTLNGVYSDMVEYFRETYQTDIDTIRTELVVRDDNDIYGYLEQSGLHSIAQFSAESLRFADWSGWRSGIYVQASTNVLGPDGEEIFYKLSNKIPLTQEIFKYLVGDPISGDQYDSSGNKLNGTKQFPFIDIEKTDMNIYNIRAVNKLQNMVVQMDNPQDSKAGLIQPVFFQTRSLQDLVVHPAVTENIQINLDAYKSKVSTFILQIEGCTFEERGRTGRGVIFAVTGSILPRNVEAGTFYILNENYEMVTSGKFRYE